MPVDKFDAVHWGRRPLLCRAADQGAADVAAAGPDRAADKRSQGFVDLLTVADVDELVSQRGLRAPFIRMATQGTLVDPHRYTGPGGAGAHAADQALDERILEQLADGVTLVLQGLHRLWPPLMNFAGQLATELAHPVAVNAYLTPPGNRGFATHYDTHDVFVLQAAGTKRWRVHPPVFTDPLPTQPWSGHTEEITATADTEPILDVVLKPGDTLYLPRGWLHSAQARQELSMHLTVGVITVTRHTLVTELLAMAAEEPTLRRGLPLGTDAGDPRQLGGELAVTARALTAWLAQVDPEAMAARLRHTLWPQSRPAPIRPLAHSASLLAAGQLTRMALRPRLRWRLAPAGAETVALELFDRTITFPAQCGAALRALLTGEVEAVHELPGLTPDERLVLARRLLKEAVVIPLDE